jgi:hypothetical protein
MTCIGMVIVGAVASFGCGVFAGMGWGYHAGCRARATEKM